jgi:hypothetical protein
MLYKYNIKKAEDTRKSWHNTDTTIKDGKHMAQLKLKQKRKI